MGFRNYTFQPGDTRTDLSELVGFLGHLVGSRRALILTLLAGGMMVGEVTGVNDTIRQKTSAVLIAPPDQGGPLHLVHDYLRKHYHPDGEEM